MEDSTVDDVLAGRRFPFSRAWAACGFARHEAEAWRRAGWRDPERAARWHGLGGDASPAQLRSLAVEGYGPEQVVAVARLAGRATAAWVRALASPDVGDNGMPTIDEAEIDLRDRVRANLQLGQTSDRSDATPAGSSA